MPAGFAISFEPVAGESRELGFADTLDGARECAVEEARSAEERGRVVVRARPGRGRDGIAFRIAVEGLPDGVARRGRWAHVMWVKRQHLVAAGNAGGAQIEPVRMACGATFELFRIWHDPELPHLPRCKRCELAAAAS